MKNKGFTLVEMLAVLVILGLLIGIGVFTVDRIKDNAEKNYYVSMEDTLKIAGNDYFNDNREDRPIDDYNFVSLETLEEHSYLDPLKTYDKKENCDKSSGVYIYNTENGNEYEVCLKCGIHKSTGLYCNGKKTGQIMITGSTNTGGFYNPTLSYAGTPWTNASSVNITFTLMGEDVKTDKFEIYNGNNDNLEGTCTSVIDNSCTKNMSVTGSYYVVAYDGVDKVGNRKYFNVKIDNMAPTFDIKDMEEEKDLENKYEYPYNNEIINIHDDNGYKSVVFSLKELVDKDPSVNIVNKDLTASNLRILENLQSGKYLLTVTVTDYARNSTTKTLEFTVKYNVNMVYFDNNEKKHDIGTIRVYTNGKYVGLLNEIKVNGKNSTINWYDNTDYGGNEYTSSTPVAKTSTHTLYGRELRSKIPVSDEPSCDNGNDFTYNGQAQTLSTAKTGYHLTNQIQTNAGTYTIIAMPDANYTWDDNTRTYKLFQCTIKPYRVSFNPSSNPCIDNVVYNNQVQNIVHLTGHEMHTGLSQASYREYWYSSDIYTIKPYIAVDAGVYNVVYTLVNSNFVWSDGTNDTKTYKCEIKKAPIAWKTNKKVVYTGYNAQNSELDDTMLSIFEITDPRYYDDASESIPLHFKATTVKSDHVYNGEVTFGSTATDRMKNNYYISNPEATTAFSNAKVTITADSAEKVYDGTALTKNTYKESGTIAANKEKLSSVDVDDEITLVGTKDNVPSSAVIKYGNIVTTNYYDITYVNGVLKVTKRNITIKAKNQDKQYDGTALEADTTCEVTSGSLATGDKVECTSSGGQTNVGTSTKKLLTVNITNSSGTDVTSSYNVKKEDGTLEVKKAVITVNAKDQAKTYDGSALSADGTCEVTSGTVPSGHTITCTSTGSITNVGETTKTLSTVIIKKGNKDLTSYFTITKTNGKLKINKRSITVKCSDQSREYNGVALQANNNCSVTSSLRLVKGHTLDCACSGAITNVGETQKKLNGVSIKKGGTNVISNYDVTFENGKLTIKKRKVTVTCSNQSKEYDGTALNASDKCSVSSGRILSSDKLFCDCEGSQTNIGTGVKELKTVTIRKGNSVVDYYDVTMANGSLTVTKRSITVTADDQSKTYNGTALSANNNCTVTSGSLLSGHSVSCSCTGSRTSVGSSTKTLSTVTISPSTAAGYYNITKANGTLTVNAAYDPTNPGPSDSSCNRHYYYLTWDCVNTSTGEYAQRGKSSKKSGYSSDAAAEKACKSATKTCGKGEVSGNVNCSSGTAWGIKFWNSSKNSFTELWPYGGGCGSRTKCAVKCF